MEMTDNFDYVYHYQSTFDNVLELNTSDPSLDDVGVILARYSLSGRLSDDDHAERLLWLSCDDQYLAE